jgi:hypothetical protein
VQLLIILLYSAGKAFATKHSEAMFLPGSDIKKVKTLVDDIR